VRFSHLDRFSHDTTTRDDDANARTLHALDVIDALEEAFQRARRSMSPPQTGHHHRRHHRHP
jgi:hypothetical protein